MVCSMVWTLGTMGTLGVCHGGYVELVITVSNLRD